MSLAAPPQDPSPTSEGTEPEAPCAPAAAHAMGAEPARQVAATLKALADPLRLRMLSLISASPQGEACVCDLATVGEVSQPTVSHHLKVLKDVGVLSAERRGSWVYYRVTPAAQTAVRSLLNSFAPAAAERVAGTTTEASPGTDGLQHARALERVTERLVLRFDVLGADVVARTVHESYAALVRSARVAQHVPVLAERFARQRLEDLVRAGTSDASRERPQVLFVCVANAGRSQLAAALLARYAGDAVVVRSAGSAPAAEVHGTVQPVLAEILGRGDGSADGAEVEAPFPKPLTYDAVRAADVVVTMGCGDTCPVLPGIRYEDWAVGDPALASPEGVHAIRDEIDRRVRALVADLLPDLHLPEETP
ncbi:metalloregulator ArsR/SmtB family transcription factor [Actinotalea sp. BY-33]|uniref:Metalloregulator ArsR/SmtB family transcription factor n=1 Tax=Actinotalea soli TaxID=2819234 RepID=A0A939RWN7_9CELL|nr:metalloregulator ArsR/SmtB family transcription factor [Actinotalea soli]MBO1752813.1 metalloregulator ArsR/SmtB family transcription factor [Actinotalea soli]